MGGELMYGTVEDVRPYNREITDAEAERHLEFASDLLNVALAAAGFVVPITQEEAMTACAGWAVARAVEPRVPLDWLSSALDFAKRHALAFRRLGCAEVN
jgi:hypothetical protein